MFNTTYSTTQARHLTRRPVVVQIVQSERPTSRGSHASKAIALFLTALFLTQTAAPARAAYCKEWKQEMVVPEVDIDPHFLAMLGPHFKPSELKPELLPVCQAWEKTVPLPDNFGTGYCAANANNHLKKHC